MPAKNQENKETKQQVIYLIIGNNNTINAPKPDTFTNVIKWFAKYVFKLPVQEA